MPFAIPIWLPAALRSYAMRLLRSYAQTSRPLPLYLPRRRLLSTPRSPAFGYSARRRSYQNRHNWSRTVLPLYGFPRVNIPVTRVIVPAGLTFAMDKPDYELGQISFRPSRSPGRYAQSPLGLPTIEMVRSIAPPRSGGPGTTPPEQHRRRKDSKMPAGLRRLYRFMHDYYGRPSEFIELMHIFQNNFRHGPVQLATALAVNAAIERAYGERGNLLKKAYQTKYWPFPVGYDTLNAWQ